MHIKSLGTGMAGHWMKVGFLGTRSVCPCYGASVPSVCLYIPGMDGEAIFVTGRGGAGRGLAKNLWDGAGRGTPPSPQCGAGRGRGQNLRGGEGLGRGTY